MPPYGPGHPPRLPGWDYANPGAYFVTVTVAGRTPTFRVGGMSGALTSAGRIVEERWCAIPERFASVRPDVFVAMPDHVHGILWLGSEEERAQGALMNQGPTVTRPFPAMADPRVTLGKVVRAWKAECTRAIRRAVPAFRWQSRYYETVIRTDRALREMRRYVRDNPLGG